MVGTDKGRGWVGKLDRGSGSDFKYAGYGRFNRNFPYVVFPGVAYLKSALPDRAAPLAAVVFLVVGVEPHPRGWVCLISGEPVYVGRAPFRRGVASPLSAATSNIRVPLRIRRYPPRQKIFQRHRPRLLIMGRVCESTQSRKNISDGPSEES
jgi:hypothetical protein